MSEKQSSNYSKNDSPVLTAEQRRQKLLLAKQKYGKPFALEIHTERRTPPSHNLLEIQGRVQSLQKITNIRELKRK